MRTISVKLGDRCYQAGVEAGLLSLRVELPDSYGRCAVITDANVARLYGMRIRAALSRPGLGVHVFAIPPGERSKTLSTVESLAQKLVAAGIERTDIIVALGGGVVGDLAGFLAATYMRGVDCLQIPTTLMAQVDSGIGGKTAVNLKDGKNLIGAFHQPVAVLIDPAVLRTLPRRHFNNGMAEVIKTAVIGDAGLFRYLEENAAGIRALKPAPLEHLLTKCLRFKARIVEQDERDTGIRAILNFGHTVGHALEAAGAYRIFLHGEAVSVGMAAAAKIAERMGMTSAKTTRRLAALLKEFNLPTSLGRMKNFDPGSLIPTMMADKKVRGGELTFVLPQRIGTVSICRGVPPDLVKEALNEMRKQ